MNTELSSFDVIADDSEMVAGQRPPIRWNVTVADLLVYTAFIECFIGIRQTQVGNDSFLIDWSGIALPTCLVIWIHLRYRLSPLVAALLNYAVNVCSAFCSGILFFHFLNPQPNDGYITIRPPSRVDQGFQWMSESFEICIVIAVIYFVVASIIQRVKTKSLA